jgi:FixJ family two-component response regulator
MQETKAIVYIVDDDDSVRKAIKRLIRSAGMEAQAFASGDDFLKFRFRDQNACMVSDVRMPGMSGLEVNQKLVERGFKLPVIFITGFDDSKTRSQARETGAFGYFRKPVDDQALLDAIRLALSAQ